MKRIIWGIVLLAVLAGLGIAAYFALGPDAGDEAASGAGGAEQTSTEPLELTDANFSSVTASGVALVDFWSPQCPPCLMQGPIVNGLAKKFAGRAIVGKLDVDSNRRAPARFRIQAIPTLILLKDGEEVRRFVGLQSEQVLAAALEEALEGE